MRAIGIVAVLLGVSLHAQSPTFRHLAGTKAGGGYVDGTAARFSIPYDVVADAAGNFYVADSGNSAIRKIGTDRAVTTVATGLDAPRQLAFAPDGTLIVADMGSRSILRVTLDGVVTAIARDVPLPEAVAVDGEGTIFVAGEEAIWMIVDGAAVVFAGKRNASERVDARGGDARFNRPTGLTFGPDGALYVADSWNHQIRRIDAEANVTTYAGSGVAGSTGGPRLTAQLWYPFDMAFEPGGDLWISSYQMQHIANGSVTHFPLYGPTRGDPAPTGVTATPFGVIVMADSMGHAIYTFNASGQMTVYAGSPTEAGMVDGAGVDARFRAPFALAASVAGAVVATDLSGLREISRDGTVRTLTNAGPNGVGITIDPSGNIYWSANNGTVIRRLSPSGQVTVMAGAEDQRGHVDGRGDAVRFGYAYGMASDATGRIFIADHTNGRIRALDPDGTVSTIDLPGPVTAGIRDVAFDGAGNLYLLSGEIVRIAPGGAVRTFRCFECYLALKFTVSARGTVYISATNGQHILYRMDPSGTQTVVGGLRGSRGNVEGTGESARFDAPAGVVVTDDGRLVVANYFGNSIVHAELPPGRRRSARH